MSSTVVVTLAAPVSKTAGLALVSVATSAATPQLPSPAITSPAAHNVFAVFIVVSLGLFEKIVGKERFWFRTGSHCTTLILRCQGNSSFTNGTQDNRRVSS